VTVDFLRQTASRTPDAPAVVGLSDGSGGEPPVWSWSELDAWVDTVASALVLAGLDPGERVAMRLPPCPEAVVLLHAVPRAGGTLVPIHAGWTEAEFARGLAAVGRPSLTITTMGEIVEWDGEGPKGRDAVRVELPGPRPDIPVALVLTSGTTGIPTPVPISQRNLIASAQGAIGRLALRPEDRWLTSISPGHIGGLALLHRAAVVGCSLLTRPHFHPDEVSVLIDSGAVTHASLVPVMLRRLLDVRGSRRAPPSLRCLLLGGAGMPAPLLDEALEKGYPIALTYGLTEASSQVATAPPDQVRAKPGSVGRPLDGVEVRIEHETGEILVRGDTVVRLPTRPETGPGHPSGDGRVGSHPGAVAARSDQGARPASVFLDADRWLHTGDLGRFDEEGDLWVVGRLSDRIVSGGVTVEPREVEEVLLRHPGIVDVAVIAAADPEWGERVVAVIVAKDANDPPTLESILDFSRERLAAAKRPRELRLVEELPRTPAGKVDRRRLARP